MAPNRPGVPVATSPTAARPGQHALSPNLPSAPGLAAASLPYCPHLHMWTQHFYMVPSMTTEPTRWIVLDSGCWCDDLMCTHALSFRQLTVQPEDSNVGGKDSSARDATAALDQGCTVAPSSSVPPKLSPSAEALTWCVTRQNSLYTTLTQRVTGGQARSDRTQGTLTRMAERLNHM